MACCRRWMRMAFTAAAVVGGAQNPVVNCSNCERFRAVSSGHLSDLRVRNGAGQHAGNNAPNWGVGVNMQSRFEPDGAGGPGAIADGVPAVADADAAALHADRIQVINGVYALTNDRAAVQSSQSARDYAAQALDAEQKKYRLGASTTANVLQMERTWRRRRTT